MLFNFRTRRALKKVGSRVDTSYFLYINNEQPMTFPNKDSVMSYIKSFREENQIYKLQIYRVEIFALN